MKPIFINNIKNKSNYNSQTVNLTPIFYTSIMNTDFILVIHIELFFFHPDMCLTTQDKRSTTRSQWGTGPLDSASHRTG